MIGQCCSGRANPWLLVVLVAGAWLLLGWVPSVLRGKGALMDRLWKVVVVIVVVLAFAAIVVVKQAKTGSVGGSDAGVLPANQSGLPRLVDVGAGTCIPCKLMAPILEQLSKEYAGRLEVVYVDLNRQPDAARTYRVKVIPTQIFYGPYGKELFRHEGFFAKEDILAKWKELGFDLSGPQQEVFERLRPAVEDNRPKDRICFMCDRDIDPRTAVAVQTEKGLVRLCGLHCYFIMYSCLTEDKTGLEDRVTVANWADANQLPLRKACLLYGHDEHTGRPWIKAFASRDLAIAHMAQLGGSIMDLDAVKTIELSWRCGFCDRACYPQDAAEVIIDNGVQTFGCCSHCALGVAARTGKDIEVRQRDGLTGQVITVRTFEGRIASIDPPTAVAWFGQRQAPDGSWVSAGCFHQGFFVDAENLKRWAEQHPFETGRQITIAQALADKMKLSAEQIKKACKIGECAPRQ